MSIPAGQHGGASLELVGELPEAEAQLRRGLERVLYGLVAATALARLVLVWRLNVNWDEFNYLAFVHDLAQHRLTFPLQTFHVHLFWWVRGVGPNEIDQVIAARIVYFVLSLGSCAFLYRTARHFTSRAAALFSVLCYLCYSNIIEHGTSFRADGLVSFVMLGVFAFVIPRPADRVSGAVAGGATALAMLFTLKTVFMLPTVVILLVIGAWRFGGHRMAACLIAFALAFGVVLGCGLLLQTAVVSNTSVEQLTTFSSRVAGVTLRSAGIFPGLPYIITTVGQNGFVWIYVVSGLMLARSSWFLRRRTRADMLALSSLALPLLSLVVYRNAFPYFFVFLIPPVLVLCSLPFEAVTQRGLNDRSYQRVAIYMIAGVSWAFSLRFAMRLPDEVTHQRRVLAAVHDVFPQPVPYIDRSGFVASFPKIGFFMSTWGMRSYLARGVPIFEELLKARQPAFLVVNSPALVMSARDTVYAGSSAYALFDEDRSVLRENFVHHWGPLYVAGKRIVLRDAATDVEMIIPGTYTVESTTPIEIDGVRYVSGQAITLASGSHRFAGVGSGTDATLRWGRSLARPSASPHLRRIFVDF